ncbi:MULTISPECIES: thioredoxin family protein [Bacillales]|uniref:Thioredoxin family protein n=1 Tax=Lysinibacillus louembei TaxID=1470088 RepID=A0ABZ0RQ87_9BACI|nr:MULTISPECIES: thioredoxin family protein [Bacillales]MCT6925172.1 thioredoxin family protein [Metasolibacillus sp.]MCT6941357.1 thioredoxin family protein [Metasolibacillus sp.]WPK10392.1 thioredoxin family protein [Lysinibacillus louembei]
MEEWTIEQWQQQLTNNDVVTLYLYTPICGTCAIASKMMDVVEQLLPTMPIGKMNLNYSEKLALELQVESVPCLVIARDDGTMEKIYAFQSVLNLYEILKSS